MSKRLNLREFQQGLTDRMKAQYQGGEQLSLLGVQIAGQNWLVDMADISEVLPLPPLTIVPHGKKWFRGVANVRGNLYCIADMACYQNLGEVSGAATNRILLLAGKHAFNAALLVERVLGLRDLRSLRFDQARDLYVDKQEVDWHKLNVTELLGQADFLQIGR
jgi:twitching motility protein PilI